MREKNNEKIEREIKETIPFTIATKIIKYLGIYLPKLVLKFNIQSYGTYTQWSTTQPLKRIHLNQF